MTIDEAIKHAKEQKEIFSGTHGEFLENVAEWLEELKERREANFNYVCLMDKRYTDGYNKAIDDLLKQVQFEEKWLFDTGTRSQDVKIAFSGIYMEAKRLKS